jgi:outer membrane protein
MFKRINILPLFFLIIFSNNLYADTKIGVVKLDVLFKEIPIYKQSQNNLKNEFKPKADELKKLETSWNKLNDDYLKNERTMSKNDRKEKIKEINQTEQEFRNKQQKLQQELQTKQNSELQRIRIIVEKAINEYAEKNDYDLILRADGTTLFAKKYVDITQDIINILILYEAL